MKHGENTYCRLNTVCFSTKDLWTITVNKVVRKMDTALTQYSTSYLCVFFVYKDITNKIESWSYFKNYDRLWHKELLRHFCFPPSFLPNLARSSLINANSITGERDLDTIILLKNNFIAQIQRGSILNFFPSFSSSLSSFLPFFPLFFSFLPFLYFWCYDA